MPLLLHIIVTCIKENIITKLQKLYSLPRNLRVDNRSPALFLKKPFCMGDLLPATKILIKRSGSYYARITISNLNTQGIPKSINGVTRIPSAEQWGRNLTGDGGFTEMWKFEKK